MYILTRKSDGTRKQGTLSLALTAMNDGWHIEGNARPRVGVQMLVGDMVVRAGPEPSVRITSPVTKIVSESAFEVVFETETGSMYHWARVEPLSH